MFKTLVLLFMMLFLAGCVQPIMMPTIEPKIVSAPWSIKVPNDWFVDYVDNTVSDDPSIIYSAESPNPIGMLPVTVRITAVVYTENDGTGESFVETPARLIDSTGRAEVVYSSTIDTEDGPMGIVVFLTVGGGLAIQLAVVHDDVGYLVTCSGDGGARKEVSATCREIIASFTLR